ncbi:MAG: bifunctional phosphopantothenoylcysteine decarboxylase/phosphopantothenate--cysteine ligase CoaBC, partial [Dehalococcoidia bacterium]
MKSAVENKQVVLGVTGSIACYKAVDLCSRLVRGGALVDVVLSRSATQFVTPLTFRSISHRPVITDMFDANSELSVEHVALARRADVVVVAPATANTIAKLAQGLADDSLTTTILATTAPVVVAPAMDAGMYDNPATQESLAKLKSRGFTIAGPGKGRLASGLWGLGRLVEPAELMGYIAAALGYGGDLVNKTVVVSAGGTVEAIDPVRVITNRSSGKMGYAIAEAARDRGANVVLVTAPTALPDPPAVEVHAVESALEMRDAVAAASKKADVLVMAAAVSDYRSVAAADQKMKKGSGDSLTIELTKNP